MPNLTGLSAFITRARVLATSAVAWLTAAGATLVVLAQLLEGIGGVPEWVTRAIATAVAIIGTITLQVRRVTPVADVDKGLLPPKGPSVETVTSTGEIHDPDVGDINIGLLLRIVALFCFVIFALIAHGTISTDEGLTWLGAGLAAWVLAEIIP